MDLQDLVVSISALYDEIVENIMLLETTPLDVRTANIEVKVGNNGRKLSVELALP
jgi:hypothetical protein